MILCILLFSGVISDSMIFRSLKVHQTSSDAAVLCNEMQRTLSETDLTAPGMDQWCKTKYLLNKSDTCGKDSNVLYWEQYQKDKNKTWITKTLDGSCCRQSTSYMLWPFWCLG